MEKPPERTMDVFISYAREDSESAQRLYHDLQQAGITVWMDKEDLPGEHDRATAIQHVLKDGAYFLALFSSHSISDQGSVQQELQIARKVKDENPRSEIFILLVRLDENIPKDDVLKGEQWIDWLEPYEKGLKQILQVVKLEEPKNGDLTDATPSEVSARQSQEQEGSVNQIPEKLAEIIDGLKQGDTSRLKELSGFPDEMINSALEKRDMEIDGDGNIFSRDLTLGDKSIVGSGNVANSHNIGDVFISVKQESPELAARLADLSTQLNRLKEEVSQIQKDKQLNDRDKTPPSDTDETGKSEKSDEELNPPTGSSSAPETDVSEAVAESPFKTKWQKFTDWLLPRITGYSVALLMFVLLWTAFFDVLFLDTRIEYLTMWAGDVLVEHTSEIKWLNTLFLPKVFDDTIVLVSESEIPSDAVWGSWRQDYARLVDIISRAGAKVIGFDLSFETVSDFDAEFIRAIKEAKQQGTAIVIENTDFSGDAPKIVPEIKAAISGYGIGCIGLPAGFAGNIPLTVELAVKMRDEKHRPSLALEIFDWYNDSIDDEYVIDRGDRQLAWNSQTSLPFSKIQYIKEDWNCTAIPGGGTVALLMINYSPLKIIRQHTIAATEVMQMEPLNAASRFKDKIVLIGAKSIDDSWLISRGIKTESRYGFEIHADALNTILDANNVIRPVNPYYQIPILLCLAFLGFFICSQTTQWHWFWRVSLLFTILAGYLIILIFLYACYHVLFQTAYHFGAFGLSYWVAAKNRKNGTA